MEISTPALLFGSISLLLLAYTNRFFVIAKLIRDLYKERNRTQKSIIDRQMPILRLRLKLIKLMQASGVLSFMVCTGSLFSLFLKENTIGEWFFGTSAILLLTSLSLGLWEVIISTKALDILLDDVEGVCKDNQDKVDDN